MQPRLVISALLLLVLVPLSLLSLWSMQLLSAHNGRRKPTQQASRSAAEELTLQMLRLEPNNTSRTLASGSVPIWQSQNWARLTFLHDCLALNSCSDANKTIVILATNRAVQAVEGGVSGENIWARSVMHSLTILGYTYLVCNDVTEGLELYHLVGAMTRMVIMEYNNVEDCWYRREEVHAPPFRCLASPEHPLDIPVWKMFRFGFWNHEFHPLGGPWHLTPENYLATDIKTTSTYLGYSVDHWCSQIPPVPTQDRDNGVYILAKNSEYFTKSKYNESLIPHLAGKGVRFTVGIGEANSFAWPDTTNLGKLSHEQFNIQLSRSRVLLGLGPPYTSPSPYYALCFGVPFVNPIENYDSKRPHDRVHWRTQHDPLKWMNPPYVYNVHADNMTEVAEAIMRALESPLTEKWVPEHMKTDAARNNVEKIVLTDWRGKAEAVLAMRKEFGGELFYMGML